MEDLAPYSMVALEVADLAVEGSVEVADLEEADSAEVFVR